VAALKRAFQSYEMKPAICLTLCEKNDNRKIAILRKGLMFTHGRNENDNLFMSRSFDCP